MARDTRGPMPSGTSELRRVSLNPGHWRQARWMLGAEAAVLAMLGGAGLVGVYLVAPRGIAFSVAGAPLTSALSWVLVGLAAVSAAAVTNRRLSLIFAVAVCIAALTLVTACGVAATHHDHGVLGSSAPAMLLYAALFCYNFALGAWLVPDHIEGPEWLPRSRVRRQHHRRPARGPHAS